MLSKTKYQRFKSSAESKILRALGAACYERAQVSRLGASFKLLIFRHWKHFFTPLFHWVYREMFKFLFLVALVEFCSLAFSWEAVKVKHAKNPAVLVYFCLFCRDCMYKQSWLISQLYSKVSTFICSFIAQNIPNEFFFLVDNPQALQKSLPNHLQNVGQW